MIQQTLVQDGDGN